MQTQANPTHLYTPAGIYTVTLTVSNRAGSASRAKPVEVIAGHYPLFLPLVRR